MEDKQINQNFLKHESDFEPKKNVNFGFLQEVKKELKREKQRLLINIYITGGVMALSLIFFLLWISLAQKNNNFLLYLSIIIFLNIVTFWSFVASLMNFYRFNQEQKIHFHNDLSIDAARLPIFAISAYKRNYFWKVFVNWFSFLTYFILSCFLFYFFILSSLPEGELRLLGGIIKIKLPEIRLSIIDKIIVFFVLGIVLSLQIYVYIQTGKNQARYNALFDLEKKINQEDWKKYKRNVNIACAIFFLIPLFLLVLLFWIIKKIWKKN